MNILHPIPKEKGIKGTIGAESEAVIAAANFYTMSYY